ncbi:FCD domain-containing protein, partial [Singulisphaera rosea]
EALRATAAVRDLDGYARHNMEFHRRIVQASENAVLLRLWDSLMLEVRTRIRLNQLTLPLDAVAETHTPIVEALAQGDGETAGRLLREHAQMFLNNLVIPPAASPLSPNLPIPEELHARVDEAS